MTAVMSGAVRMLDRCLYDLLVLLQHWSDRHYRDWYFNHSRRLAVFRDLHRGQDCFIIGNGPSLNKLDLRELNGYHTFGLNKIYLMFDRVGLDISYYVSVNKLVIDQSINELMKMKCPCFLSYGAAGGLKSNSNMYLLATDSYFEAPYTFHRDLAGPITEGYTVTYVALQIAYYMGFERIFLIGVDHEFHAVGAPNDEQLMAGEDRNHFDPRYFMNCSWNLPDLEASELSYHLARFFFSRNGRTVYDATAGGKLTIFPKISFEQALGMCRKK